MSKMKKILFALNLFMFLVCVHSETKYIRKGDSITLSAGECCLNWDKSGDCISISPDQTSCNINGVSTGNATVTVKDNRDGKTCSKYDIVVYEAIINKVSEEIGDGASKTISVSFVPATLPASDIELKISKPDGTTTYNNPAMEGSTITGSDKNWKISNARWYQGADECTTTSSYEITGTYKLDGKNCNFEPISVVVNAGGRYVNGSSKIARWYTGFPEITVNEIYINGEILYRATVSGVGSFRRSILATTSTSPTLRTSQYYDMVLAEENYHKKQLEGTVPSPISPELHFSTENVMNAILAYNVDATDGSVAKEFLINKIKNQIASEYMRSSNLVFDVYGPVRCKVETEAKLAINATFLCRLKCSYEMCN